MTAVERGSKALGAEAPDFTSWSSPRGEGEAELKAYVESAAMPCPYAKLSTSYLYLEDHVRASRTRETLRKALAEFWPDERARILAIVPRGRPKNHYVAREQAYWIRYQWHFLHLEAHAQFQNCDEPDEAKLGALYSSWISDAPSFVGPRIVVGGADIMMTAFNPLYDKEHPRYSPHAVLPVIRSKELQTIHRRSPKISFAISAHAKCKMILSRLGNRVGIEIADMLAEYPAWLDALSYYRDFVTTVYTDSYRVDPRTFSVLRENRKRAEHAMASERFKASLVAFRALAGGRLDTPSLRRILAQNPAVSVFDIAKIVFGDVAGMYVVP